MTGEPVVVEVIGLEKKYRSGDGELVVFANLDMEVRRGERLALVGESGAGKSTLLYLLSGLDRPTSGTISYLSRDLSKLDDAELAAFRNEQIGFVWQSHNLLPEFTAVENVMMPLLVRGVSAERAEPVAMERLEEVGIAARASHKAGELSGGEQQRVALARALGGNPSLLLADEPTGNLDHNTGERIFDLLTHLQKTRHLTSILVTHNLTFARRCDRILKLENGALVDFAGTGEL